MLCKDCNKPMKHIMRFDSGKSYELFRCPNCHYESKKTMLKFPITNTKQVRTNKRR